MFVKIERLTLLKILPRYLYPHHLPLCGIGRDFKADFEGGSLSKGGVLGLKAFGDFEAFTKINEKSLEKLFQTIFVFEILPFYIFLEN